MAEGFDSSSEQCFIMQTVSATAENASVILKNESGETLLSGTVPCSFTSIILSAPQLQMGETCTVVIDGTETAVVVDNSSSGGFGMGGRFGGMRGGMNGEMNGGETPQFPGTLPSDSQDASSGDIQNPAQYHMKFRDPSGDNSFQPDANGGITTPDQNAADWQPGQTGGFMQRGQRQNWNAPAAETETITVSPETWSLIGISALCLVVGLLVAWRTKH